MCVVSSFVDQPPNKKYKTILDKQTNKQTYKGKEKQQKNQKRQYTQLNESSKSLDIISHLLFNMYEDYQYDDYQYQKRQNTNYASDDASVTLRRV